MPQDSILGPFLFLIYNNDLPLHKTRESKMAIFADDTSIMKANTRDQLNLQTDLAKINDWFCYNKLTINTDKCETRQERLKSALYLRLKKREVFKIVKGDSFGFLKIQFVAKYQEN